LSSVPSDARATKVDSGPPDDARFFNLHAPVAGSYSGQITCVTLSSKSVTMLMVDCSTGQLVVVIAIVSPPTQLAYVEHVMLTSEVALIGVVSVAWRLVPVGKADP
jgi:hypothetical protein